MFKIENSVFILLNGPAKSGKTSSADHMRKLINTTNVIDPKTTHAHVYYFADLAKSLVNWMVAGKPTQTVRDCVYMYELEKDVSLPEFGWKTPRAAYITFLERFIIPFFGANFVVKRFLDYVEFIERQNSAERHIWILPDIGMLAEFEEIFTQAGAEKLTLVHVKRPGKTFDGDCRRSYDYGDKVRTYTLYNDDTMAVFLERTEKLIHTIMSENISKGYLHGADHGHTSDKTENTTGELFPKNVS